MADSKGLAPELIALVHHIELNKAGWWDVAIQRLILTAFYLRKQSQTLSVYEICAALKERYAVEISEPTVRGQLEILVGSGDILEPQRGRFKVLEAAIARCEIDIQVATELEAEVRERFDTLLTLHCPLIDSELAWSCFADEFLIPLVRQLGASTYELLAGLRGFDQLPQIDAFVRSFEPEQAINLNKFLREFLDPANAPLRRFVLRTMNAYFVVRAGGLSESTIKQFAKSAKPFAATLFFDSNVLFSLLGLHENPADESSRNLLTLVHRLSASVPIKLRVLPPTLDEMKRAIKLSQEAVIDMRISSKLLGSASHVGLAGITAKFLTLSAGLGGTVAPADYFEPYLNNLVTILNDSGVGLFNENLNPYRSRQDVVDDLLEQLDRERQRYGPHAKNYERLEHDIILWHFVNDKRPPRPESPIDAKFWIVTADFRFLGFDAYKHRSMPSEVPICLHPIALVQLLQFWVPMDSELETALFSAIRLPTVLAPFDSQAEKVSLKILNALSTFENIAEMPEDTTTRILLNEALRQKLALEKDLTAQIELVKEALIEENRKAEERVIAEKARSAEIQQQSKSLEGRLAKSLQNEVALQTALQEALAREKAATESNERFARLERERADSQLALRERRRTRFLFTSVYVISLVVCLAAYVEAQRVFRQHLAIALMGAFALVAWAVLFWRQGSRNKYVREWLPFRLVMAAKFWLALAILGGIIGNGAWEQFKEATKAKDADPSHQVLKDGR